MVLTTTLCFAAACAIINTWLAMRISPLRQAHGISVGDGGNELLARRMRAQLNFVENTPWVLALVAGIELAGRGGRVLPVVAAVYVLARVAHPFGMDGKVRSARTVGTLLTTTIQIALAIWAVTIAAGW